MSDNETPASCRNDGRSFASEVKGDDEEQEERSDFRLEDEDMMDFLALLCEELGDKEAMVRAYRRWENGKRVKVKQRTEEEWRSMEEMRQRILDHPERRSFASAMWLKGYEQEKEREEEWRKEHGSIDRYHKNEHKEGTMRNEEKLERRDGMPPYDEKREKGARRESWASGIAQKIREKEEKRPRSKDKEC